MKKELQVLKALANKKRLEILRLLNKELMLRLTEISEKIDLSYKSTSRHLLILSSASLIRQKREGSWMIYSLRKESRKIITDISYLK